VNSILSLRDKSFDSVATGEQVTTAYQILDYFPAFSEKLDRCNTQRNIAIDAEHIFMASGSIFLVCGDKKMV
jgi:hypothetical protein